MKHNEPHAAPSSNALLRQAVCAGDFVFLSGQVPIDPQTGLVVHGTVTEEGTLVFENIKAALAGVGAALSDVVKVQAYLSDSSFKPEFNALYRNYFSDPLPARTVIGTDISGIKVEIDVIAYKKPPERGL